MALESSLAGSDRPSIVKRIPTPPVTLSFQAPAPRNQTLGGFDFRYRRLQNLLSCPSNRNMPSVGFGMLDLGAENCPRRNTSPEPCRKNLIFHTR
jgi:hypothetical protein